MVIVGAVVVYARIDVHTWAAPCNQWRAQKNDELDGGERRAAGHIQGLKQRDGAAAHCHILDVPQPQWQHRSRVLRCLAPLVQTRQEHILGRVQVKTQHVGHLLTEQHTTEISYVGSE